MTTRAAIVAAARSCLGTPWHHRGRVPGLALDCAGLPVYAGRATGSLPQNFDISGYGANPDGSMHELLDQHMGGRVAKADMQPGDLIAVITQKEERAPEQHIGILSDYRHGGLGIIHASNDRLHKAVIEHRLMFSRNFRFAGAWRFPGIE